MGIVETFVVPLELRRPNAMFTLREIFYNEKLRSGSRAAIRAGVREKCHPTPEKFAEAAQTDAARA